MNTNYEIQFNPNNIYIYIDKADIDVRKWKLIGSSDKKDKIFEKDNPNLIKDIQTLAYTLFEDPKVSQELIYDKLSKINEATQIIENRYETKISKKLWKLTHKSKIKEISVKLKQVKHFRKELQTRLLLNSIEIDQKNKQKHDWGKLALLIKNGADPSKEINGRSAVSIAVLSKDEGLFRFLYEKSSHVSIPNRLRKPEDHSFSWILRVLVNDGYVNQKFKARFDLLNIYLSRELLSFEEKKYLIPVLEGLIDLGLIINRRNSKGDDLLKIAIFNKDFYLAKWLCTKGAKPDTDHLELAEDYALETGAGFGGHRRPDYAIAFENLLNEWDHLFKNEQKGPKKEHKYGGKYSEYDEKQEAELKNRQDKVPKVNTAEPKKVYINEVLFNKQKFQISGVLLTKVEEENKFAEDKNLFNLIKNRILRGASLADFFDLSDDLIKKGGKKRQKIINLFRLNAHPDKTKDPQASEVFRFINAAWEALKG